MEEKTYEKKDFEFTLLMNERIIVQRNFDVMGYNDRAVNSLTFKDGIDSVMNIIEGGLRKKSIAYMLENIMSFYENPKADTNDLKDVITFRLTHLDREITNRKIDATIYPARIRYTVNIKDQIYDIINTIQKSLSQRKLNTDYLGYSTCVN